MKRVDYVPVDPAEGWKSKNGIRAYYYDHIRVYDFFSDRYIERQMNNHLGGNKVTVIQDDDYYHFQYEGKPRLSISKLDGMIFTTEDIWNNNDHLYVMHQAAILLDILNKLGFVEGRLRKRYFSFNKYGKEIIENIPSIYIKGKRGTK